MANIAALADRIEIIDCCTRVHWCYDHESWDDLALLFAEVVAMPTVAQAADPGFEVDSYLDQFLVDRQDLVGALRSFKSGLVTQHLIAGHQVVLRGDAAVCSAHSINIHVPTEETQGGLLAHGNEYRFDLIRVDDGWRIRGWVPQVKWSWGDTKAHDAAAKQEAWLQERLRTR